MWLSLTFLVESHCGKKNGIVGSKAKFVVRCDERPGGESLLGCCADYGHYAARCHYVAGRDWIDHKEHK